MYSPLWEFTLQFSSKLSRLLLKQHRDKVSRTALKGSGKNRFFSRLGKIQGILNVVKKILNSTSKSVKSQGILFIYLFFWPVCEKVSLVAEMMLFQKLVPN